MPLVSELLRSEPRGARPVESEIWTTCPICSEKVGLGDAVVDRDDPLETTYHCPRRCGPVIVISLPGAFLWQGGGWRTGDWVVRNVSDIYWQRRGWEPVLLLRAKVHAAR